MTNELSYLNELNNLLSRAKADLSSGKPNEKAFRELYVQQIEYEKVREINFLAKRGIIINESVNDMSDQV